jgi:hypothetical protein
MNIGGLQDGVSLRLHKIHGEVTAGRRIGGIAKEKVPAIVAFPWLVYHIVYDVESIQGTATPIAGLARLAGVVG